MSSTNLLALALIDGLPELDVVVGFFGLGGFFVAPILEFSEGWRVLSSDRLLEVADWALELLGESDSASEREV